MKRNLVLCTALLAAVILSITCCGYIISRGEYSSVVPHVSSMSEDSNGIPHAANYNEFKNQVVKLVENAQTHGTIHLERYAADVEEDLARALHEVMTEMPIGAYAVDMMYFDHTRVLSYYDVKVSVRYKRPREEILAMVSADSAEEFSAVMEQAIAERRSPFAVQCNYYTEQIINVAEAIEDLRFNRPGAAYGVRDVTVQFFPVTGVHKILLVEFDFYESLEDSTRKSAQAQAMVENIEAQTAGMAADDRLREVFRLIVQDTVHADGGELGDVDTPYGALVQKRASDKGFAAAVEQVCSRIGAYSVVVKGELDGAPHFWNMVYAENAWVHVDLSRGVVFARDPNMAGYTWDGSRYPTDLRKNMR